MKTVKQKLKEIPLPNASWERISKYALIHNGYTHNTDLANFANSVSIYFSNKKEIPDPFDIGDLKDCLFYEQRRFRHFGYAPSGEDFEYIKALMSGIRKRTIESLIGNR